MTLNDMGNITRKLTLGFVLLLLVFFFFSLFSLYGLRTSARLTHTIYSHPLVVSNAALQVRVSITKIHRNMKDLVLFKSAERVQQAIAAVDKEEQVAYQHLDIVRDSIIGNAGKNLEQETRTLFTDWRPIREEVITLVNNGQRDDAVEITIGKGAVHVAQLEKNLLALTDYARNKASFLCRWLKMTHRF